MNGLKERLQRLKRSGAAEAGGRLETAAVEDGAVADRTVAFVEGEAGGTRSGAAQGPDSQAAVDARSLAAAGWEAIGDVRIERNSYGSFVLRERTYDAKHRHGCVALGELAELAGELGALAAGAAAGSEGELVELERLLFFDTETTGLGIGAGNVPFMIGLGSYEATRFVVRQLFIRNPAEEAAMLFYFEQLLERFTHIVSYNGRSFDWPIVQSRFVLARRGRARDEWRHIDLLYAARSLWKTVLPSCRLGTVETDKLGFRRHDDVPGSMAPVLYVQYLAERDPRIVGGVFVHNEHDIVSLAALAVYVAKLLRGEEAAQGCGEEELLRLSLWLDKLKRPELAERMRAQLAARLLGGAVRPGRERLLLELASAYKRRARFEAAAELWRRLVAERGGSFACPLEPYVELAMHCEHRERRYGEALAHAEEALNLVWKRMSLTRVDERQRQLAEALQRRIRRLLGKQRREAARRAVPGAATQEAGGGDAVMALRKGAAGDALQRADVGVREPTGGPSAASEPRAAVWPNAARSKRTKPQYVRESLI
jgi:hypothetical protein